MFPAAKKGSSIKCQKGLGSIQGYGVADVLVNGQPIAALGDFSPCLPIGDGDVILQGASQVIVGQLPAVHFGHGTYHSGAVIGQLSPDVFIGGPTFTLPDCIKLQGGRDWMNKTIRDLYFIAQTENGKELFRRLEESGKTLLIKEKTSQWELEKEGSVAHGWPPDWSSPGNGTDAVVVYDPDPSPLKGVYTHEDGRNTTQTPQVVLFHEMVHGLHMMDGSAVPGDQREHPEDFEKYITDPGWDGYKSEEAHAIGDNAYEDSDLSENTLRDELGMPRRHHIAEPPIDPADYHPSEEYPNEGKSNLRPGAP